MIYTTPVRFLWTLVGFLWLGLWAGIAGQETNRIQIERHSREAEQALANKDLGKAASSLEKLAQLTPDVAEVHGNLGMVYYNQGRYGNAAEAFQRALKLDSKMTDAELMLGICFTELGRHSEAVPLLEPAFRHPPDNQIGRLVGLELERAYAGLREYAKANAVSDELLIRYPKDPEILFYASRLHGDQALLLMGRLVAEAPESLWVRLSRAEVFESRREYEVAINEYHAVLQMDPRLPGIHFQLGRVLLLSSETEKTRDEALRAFQKELVVDPQNSSAWYEIGEIHRRRGQFDQALEAFTQAIRYHAEFEDAQIALGRTLMNLGRPQDALPHLLAAVRLNPTNEVSHFQLASIYKSLGDMAHYQEEMALFQKHHVRPHAAAARRASEALRVLPSEVTKQELDPDAGSQP